jgi:hypothetical protein
MRRGGMQHLVAGSMSEQGMDLAEAAGHGLRRAVGQVGLERAPDPLDRVVVGVARAVQQLKARLGGQVGLTALLRWMMTLSSTIVTTGASR